MTGPLFDGLPSAVRDAALAHFRAVRGEAGAVLIEPASPAPGALYIASGRVAVQRDGRTIDASGPGEIVGEMSLFTGKPPVASIVALEPTEALALDADGFTALHADRNEVAHRFERQTLVDLARRLRRLDTLVAERSPGERSPFARPSASAFDRIRAMLFGTPAPEPVRPRPRHPVEILYDSPAFRHLDPLVRTEIAKETKLEAVPAGTFLCTQGEPGDAMYLLAYGHVDVFVVVADDPPRVHRLGEVIDGTMFGLTALMDDRPRMASCVARDKVDVLVLPRERWKRMYDQSTIAASALRQAVIGAFSDQVDEAGRNVVALTAPDDAAVSVARVDPPALKP